MFPNKKPAPKTNWPFFFLGMATFLVIPLVAIVLMSDYPNLYKIASGVVLGGICIFVVLGTDKEHEHILLSNKAVSFMSGLGLCFLISIVLFFGAMVWGTLQS